MLTVLHGSDLHFGKPFDAGVADVFLSTIKEISPDLLVLSGDFTQRAKIREFRQAREFLRALPALPLVVTPGNHDVPLYRVWERLLTPLRNYREFISPELDTHISVEGATIVSLNSTAPRRAIVNGHLGDRQLLFAARAFKEAPKGDVRIVVFHHHLAPAPDWESDQVLPGFQRCLDAFAKMKVELILGGHLHRAYVANSLDAYSGAEGRQRIVIAHSGTTTSTRGRARERNKNSFNLIHVSGYQIVVTHHQFLGDDRRFVPVRTHAFPRGTEAFLRAGPTGGVGEGRNGPALTKGGNP
jgi:3',5'-cyclic AMP phosphodiesterase CpdA